MAGDALVLRVEATNSDDLPRLTLTDAALVQGTLGLKGVSQSAVHALVLGVPDPSRGATQGACGD